MVHLVSSIQRIPTIEALNIRVKPVNIRVKPPGRSLKIRFSNSSRELVLQSVNLYGRRSAQPLIVAVANTKARGFNHKDVSIPNKPGSPEGEFLSAVLQNQRHLFQFAVSEQLNELSSNKDGASARKIRSSGLMESVLYKRIAEKKEKELQTAVEDVMYMSVVHKFSRVEVPMITSLAELINTNNLDIWLLKVKELESIHNLQVQEMVREHLASILHKNGKSSPAHSPRTTKVDRLDLGRIYASSVRYGYFLKSASFRREMDLSLARSHVDVQYLGHNTYYSVSEIYLLHLQSLQTFGPLRGSERLSSYVKNFDSESLQRCAKIKSKETVNVVEKHTWAIFGDGSIDGEIVISFSNLERLALEAVAFGSFLWEVERSVDSTYTLQKN